MTHSGGKPHTNIGDRGQRYEILYYNSEFDGDYDAKVFGWTDTREKAERMVESIKKWPAARDPFIRDRVGTLSPSVIKESKND